VLERARDRRNGKVNGRIGELLCGFHVAVVTARGFRGSAPSKNADGRQQSSHFTSPLDPVSCALAQRRTGREVSLLPKGGDKKSRHIR
jgi:hypothetical protein